jgi:hypothetical protein
MNDVITFPITVESHRAFLEARLDWTFWPTRIDECMLQSELECEHGYDVCSLPTTEQVLIIDEHLQEHWIDVPDFFVQYQHACWDRCEEKGALTGKECLDILNKLAGLRTFWLQEKSEAGVNIPGLGVQLET